MKVFAVIAAVLFGIWGMGSLLHKAKVADCYESGGAYWSFQDGRRYCVKWQEISDFNDADYASVDEYLRVMRSIWGKDHNGNDVDIDEDWYRNNYVEMWRIVNAYGLHNAIKTWMDDEWEPD